MGSTWRQTEPLIRGHQSRIVVGPTQQWRALSLVKYLRAARIDRNPYSSTPIRIEIQNTMNRDGGHKNPRGVQKYLICDKASAVKNQQIEKCLTWVHSLALSTLQCVEELGLGLGFTSFHLSLAAELIATRNRLSMMTIMMPLPIRATDPRKKKTKRRLPATRSTWAQIASIFIIIFATATASASESPSPSGAPIPCGFACSKWNRIKAAALKSPLERHSSAVICNFMRFTRVVCCLYPWQRAYVSGRYIYASQSTT